GVRGLGRCQRPVLVQEVSRVDSSGERPFLLIPPAAADEYASLGGAMSIAPAHDENAHGRGSLDSVRNAFQPTIEPSQLEVIAIEDGVRAELRHPRMRLLLAVMGPWADNEPLGC